MTDPLIYGKALYELAREEHLEDRIKDDLSEIRKAILKNPEITLLLDCPGVCLKERCKVISDCFAGAHEYVINFIKILVQNLCMYLFLKCADSYNSRYDVAHGIEHITAVTVIPMTDGEKEQLIRSLQKKRGKKIVLKNVIDPSILGGVILKFPDSLADASLLGHLNKAKDDLHKEKIYGY